MPVCMLVMGAYEIVSIMILCVCHCMHQLESCLEYWVLYYAVKLSISHLQNTVSYTVLAIQS